MAILEREPLLAALTEQLAQTRLGRGRLILVSGEAGIGKTSLVNAFVAGLPRGTRVLRGGCDPVVPARPFAPVADMGQHDSALRAALDEGDRDRVFGRFLRLLRALGSGAVVVVEDLHWADSATLDLLRVVGRRLAETPVLLVLTYRGHDLDAEHPFRTMLGDVPPADVTELEVPALTVSALRTLATGTQIDADRLYAATGGNPFFATEVLATSGTMLPTTVRDAVAARAARLAPGARAALQATAVLGGNVDQALVLAVAGLPDAPAGIRECLRRGLLIEDRGRLVFRHDLAREAVLDRLAPSERAQLAGRALAAYRRGLAPADDARLDRHAIEAGDVEAIVELAPRAARRASDLGAHAEAADYLAIALAIGTDEKDPVQAGLLERYAYECSMAGRIAAARTAQETALRTWRRLGDRRREGDAMRALATYMWIGGEGDAAREQARSAVTVLESLEAPGRELAHAYAKHAQLLLNSAQDDATARVLAAQALKLAEQVGDEALAVHAATTLALADTYPENPADGEIRGLRGLENALAQARAAGLTEDVARILINLVETAKDHHRLDVADHFVAEAMEFFRDREFHLYRDILESRNAQMDLQRGRWTAAERLATGLLDGARRSSQVRNRALGVLGVLRARRGQPGAWTMLDEAIRVAGSGELQETCPLHALRAEAAWLEGDTIRAGDEAMTGLELAVTTGTAYWYSSLSFWGWRTGRAPSVPDGTHLPYVLHVQGRHRAAADAWLALGFPYEAGLALADSDAEADLREATRILHGLGARRMAERAGERLRERGARQVPRGPRPSTRANPAGLSDRELEILRLLRTGARNQEIAERLVLSPKTVDHHVSAVLRKLGVKDRAAAGQAARELGVEDGDTNAPT